MRQKQLTFVTYTRKERQFASVHEYTSVDHFVSTELYKSYWPKTCKVPQ